MDVWVRGAGTGALVARSRAATVGGLSGGARRVAMEPLLSELFGGFPGPGAGAMPPGGMGCSGPASSNRPSVSSRSSGRIPISSGRGRGSARGPASVPGSAGGPSPSASAHKNNKIPPAAPKGGHKKPRSRPRGRNNPPFLPPEVRTALGGGAAPSLGGVGGGTQPKGRGRRPA